MACNTIFSFGSRCAGLACFGALALTLGCGDTEPELGAEPPGSTSTSELPAATQAQQAAPPQTQLTPTSTSWTPEALEELLAPVALYPDPVLAQVLTAATNPQEVLDAGNWLISNPDLSGKALDEAAATVGFTPPIRALIQFPQVIDQMCLGLGWTEELGQAYVNDQAGVMDAVQRLRAQAQEVGTLQSSDKMTVATEPAPEPAAPVIITIEPASPEVVYVPQYDPVTAYAQQPASAPAPAPAAPTTQQNGGNSTGSLVATGLLAFGAGMLVNEVFDDDDYWDSGYYGNMWYRPMPYYPPYPYRPVYGGGFYPSYGYNRPTTYVRNNDVMVVNRNDSYWNRYGNDRDIAANRAQARSPITAAKPQRPELAQLNANAAQGPRRPAPDASQAWRGQATYAGANPASRDAARERASAAPSAERDLAAGAAERDRAAAVPKVQGTYAGARPAAEARPAERASSGERTRATTERPERSTAARPTSAEQPAARSAPSSSAHTTDRGRAADGASRERTGSAAARPAADTALAGANRGNADRAASTRGRHSAASGVPQRRSSGGASAGGRRR